MKFFDEEKRKSFWYERSRRHPHVEEAIPILPLRNTTLFPGVVLPLTIVQKNSIHLIEDAFAEHQMLGVVGLRHPQVEHPTERNLLRVGVFAKILRTCLAGERAERLLVHVQGLQRLRILHFS
ncbi:MAG: LON peptidase substrate-binding domain-containing protein, partial [Myxococcota bacterium]